MDKYRISEVSAASPDMPDEEFKALVEDIYQKGQLVPIWVRSGEVVDGRKRLRACELLNIRPKTVDVGPGQEAKSLARSLNILRTHYSPSQRAMFASERANATPASGPAIRDRKNGSWLNLARIVTLAQAATEVSVARSAVVGARRIGRNAAPEVIEAVKAGKLTLHAAGQIVKAVPEKANQAAAVKAVVEAAKGKARHSPVATPRSKHPQLKRLKRQPAAVQFDRTLSAIEAHCGTLLELHDALEEPQRSAAAERLSRIRSTLAKIAHALEKRGA